MDFNFPIYETGLSFSPDSRYLAFLTPGEVRVDKTGWPTSVITTTEHVFINLLDLHDQRLLWSALSTQWSDLSWSPTSSYLAYQNPSMDWQLLDIDNKTVFPITTAGGINIYRLEWSFDGRYLSILVCYLQPHAGCNYRTTIIDIASAHNPASP